MSNIRDTIYADSHGDVSPFKFDSRVASVFSDMISRSVPSYQPILAMLPTLTREFRKDQHRYYDLGCSLGAGLHAMAEGLKNTDQQANIHAKLIGVDNSSAMLAHAKEFRCPYDNLSIQFYEQDLRQTVIDKAAMVLMNFTLQFVALEDRDQIVANIHQGLAKGGALVLSEKVRYQDTQTADLMTRIHHRYKADQGYSQLEISQKRDAIENVLLPETLDCHITRLRKAGFKVITPWIQNLQFISILAVK